MPRIARGSFALIRGRRGILDYQPSDLTLTVPIRSHTRPTSEQPRSPDLHPTVLILNTCGHPDSSDPHPTPSIAPGRTDAQHQSGPSIRWSTTHANPLPSNTPTDSAAHSSRRRSAGVAPNLQLGCYLLPNKVLHDAESTRKKMVGSYRLVASRCKLTAEVYAAAALWRRSMSLRDPLSPMSNHEHQHHRLRPMRSPTTLSAPRWSP
jgi:hypothetical protein